VAPIVPDPKKIKSFRTEDAFENWLSKNHARETDRHGRQETRTKKQEGKERKPGAQEAIEPKATKV
jgi:hypothetical protein